MNKAEKAEANRQGILDHLVKNGKSTLRQIQGSVKLSRSVLSGYMLDMVEAREVTSESSGVSKFAPYYYSALVVCTYRKVGLLTLQENLGVRTVHRGTNGAHPIPDQGGQGRATPRRVSSLGYAR